MPISIECVKKFMIYTYRNIHLWHSARSVSIVLLWTKGHGVCLFFWRSVNNTLLWINKAENHTTDSKVNSLLMFILIVISDL
jgi:hypothetical protein